MAYTKQTWENLPSQTTPINADRLTHIEDGIFNAASTADTAASDASSAISGLADKVDKVEGKGLSTNDFTDALKTKLDNVEAGAEVNVQSDWNQSDNSADDYIKNKPSLGTSAYKNSTSVVTDSSDLVESGAVYTALQGKVDNSVIGTVEDGTNPTKAYAVGEHMIRGGKFCTVTSPVTTSSTWVEGSNYTSGDVAGEFNPKAYISTGLSFTNCSYVAGGYTKFNNLVIINIRVSCSETASGLNIDGFPTYTNKTISNKNIVPLKCYRMSDNSADAYYSAVGTNGRVVIYGNIIGNKEYAVSGLYLCD